MTPRDLTTILLAVLGVYLLGDSITQVGIMVFFLSLESPDEYLRQSQTAQGLLAGAAFVLEAGFGLSLLFLRRRIVRLLFSDESQPVSRVEASDLQAALFAVLGVYFAVTAIAALAQGIASLSPDASLADLWPHYAGSTAQGLLGVALFFGAGVASGAWFLARQAGRVR